MGTRTQIQILDSRRNVVAVLFSYSSHETQFAEDVLMKAIADVSNHEGPTALVQALLTERYLTADDNHSVGDRVFWMLPFNADEGDCEEHLTVVSAPSGLGKPGWILERREVA